jgi:hypothetical protein
MKNMCLSCQGETGTSNIKTFLSKLSPFERNIPYSPVLQTQGFRLPLATFAMVNKTWLWLENWLLWLIKISTFLLRFLLEIPNLRKCG